MSSIRGDSGRRSFLRLAGSMLAGGLGAIALGSSAEASPRPAYGGSTQQCTDYCYVRRCNGCGEGVHSYRCYTPDGFWYGLCVDGDCGDFCI